MIKKPPGQYSSLSIRSYFDFNGLAALLKEKSQTFYHFQCRILPFLLISEYYAALARYDDVKAHSLSKRIASNPLSRITGDNSLQKSWITELAASCN